MQQAWKLRPQPAVTAAVPSVCAPAKPVRPSRSVSAASSSSNPECDVNVSSSQSSSRRAALVAGTAVALAAAAAQHPPAAQAGLDSYNTTSTPIETVEMQLGSGDGQLMFTPSTLTFTAGRVYKLHLTNPSQQTHYVTALEFADKIYTILVLANGVEVKGKVQEVALKKGAEATWMFVPIKSGQYPLKCTVKGHSEAGMVGMFIIEAAPGSAAAAVVKK